MSKLTKLLVAAALALIVAGASAALAATKTVRVGDDWFVSARGSHTVAVKRGTTVAWRFVGDAAHNVTVTRGPVRFASPTKADGSYRRRMTRRGTYRIICTIHGDRQRMTLRVR